MNSGKQINTKEPHVGIIVLNWNSWEDTLECLESLYQIDYPNYSVIVMDNGSENKSIRKIKEYSKGGIKVKSKFCKYIPDNKPIEVIEISDKKAEEFKKDTGELHKFKSQKMNKRMMVI